MRFVVLDTETVGFKVPPLPASGIVQVAWTDIDPDKPRHTQVHCHTTNPGCEIDPKASAVHGLYAEDVQDCPKVKDVFGISGPCVAIGHNVAFDLKFVSRYIDNLVGSLCTYELAKRYIRNSKNHKLTTLTGTFGLEQGKAHDAGGDVFSTVSLLMHISSKTKLSVRQLYEKHNLPTVYELVPFGKHKGKTFDQVPLSYINWYLGLNENDQDKSLRLTLLRELQKRGIKSGQSLGLR